MQVFSFNEDLLLPSRSSTRQSCPSNSRVSFSSYLGSTLVRKRKTNNDSFVQTSAGSRSSVTSAVGAPGSPVSCSPRCPVVLFGKPSLWWRPHWPQLMTKNEHAGRFLLSYERRYVGFVLILRTPFPLPNILRLYFRVMRVVPLSGVALLFAARLVPCCCTR